MRNINLDLEKDEIRHIRIYLPTDYDDKKRFPVIYMMDGKNLFDKHTSYAGEWGVDEIIENRIKEYMILKFRTIDGVNISEFEQKFGINPLLAFRFEIEKLVNDISERGIVGTNLTMNDVAARSSLSMYSMFVDSDLFMKVLIF